MSIEIRRAGADSLPIMHAMNRLYGEAFDDRDTYCAQPPTDDYLRDLLDDACFIALAAIHEGNVIGALTAYELRKFERQRSEIYIYDLAVRASFRRQGVATALIETTRDIAARRGAWVVMIQADTNEEDQPAIALYSKLGKREAVLHFDIAVDDA